MQKIKIIEPRNISAEKAKKEVIEFLRENKYCVFIEKEIGKFYFQ